MNFEQIKCFKPLVKTLLVRIKLIIIIITTGCMQLSAEVFAQRVTLDEKNATLTQIIRKIEKQSNYTFFYNRREVRELAPINISVSEESVLNTLEKLFRGKSYGFEIQDRIIILSKKTQSDAHLKTAVTHLEPVIQERFISGQVTDSLGSPLKGVTVRVKNTTTALTTDDNGTYRISVVGNDQTLVFSMVGYETIEYTIGNETVINLAMAPIVSDLDEAVVVAFGTQKKSSLTSSITTVKPSDLKIPSSNLTTALAGNIAGIIAYQRTGEPGADNADFFVRGITTFGTNNSPLILIDGIELTATDLARLQPDEIESFSVMKDATATALYGARGANGVIFVTTKTGKVGKARISFRVENSMSTPTTQIELADPVTYMKLTNEARLTRDPLSGNVYPQSKIERTQSGTDPIRYPANDWLNQLLNKEAFNQRYNLSVSGGGGVARYYVAAAYSKDNGIYKMDKKNNFNNNIDIDIYNLRSNVNIDLTPTTEMIVRLNGNFEEYNGPIHSGAEMYNNIMHSNPVMFPAYYEPDTHTQHLSHIIFGNDWNNISGPGNTLFMNPYAEMVKGYRDRSRSQVLASLEFKQNLNSITEGLRARALINVTRLSQNTVVRSYSPFYYNVNFYDAANDQIHLNNLNPNTGREYLSFGSTMEAVTSTNYMEVALDYDRTFGDNGITNLLVFQGRESNNALAGTLETSLPSRNLGLSGRTTYAFRKKYFGEFNFGYNGSERFSKEHRWGFFPSFGLAWLVSNEPFFEGLKPTISSLKFRGSYGVVGNDNIGAATDRFYYLSIVNMEATNRTGIFGENFINSINGVTVNRYSNEALTWERAYKRNIAVELGLLDNSLNIIAELYSEKRDNILMTRSSIPSTMGLSSVMRANVGEAASRGVDLSLEYQYSSSNKWWVSSRGNFTFARNHYQVYEEPQYTEYWRSRVGYPINQNFGYIAERLFIDDAEVRSSPTQNIGPISEVRGGDIKYTDVNKDGIINERDQVPIGNPTFPEIIYGFGGSAGYANFDFSFMFQGLANESFWINPKETSPFQRETQLLRAYAESHWSEDNQNEYALWPRLSTTLIENNNVTSTWFMRDGSFLRLKQVELGYTVPRTIQDRINTSSFRFYVSCSNPIAFSSFKMWDVEMGGNGLAYPIQRVFNIGINLSFN